MWASLGAWFVRIALPLVLNWAKDLVLEGLALLAAIFLRKKADKVIEDRNNEGAKPIQDIVAQPKPDPQDKEAMKKREEAVDEAAKDLLG